MNYFTPVSSLWNYRRTSSQHRLEGNVPPPLLLPWDVTVHHPQPPSRLRRGPPPRQQPSRAASILQCSFCDSVIFHLQLGCCLKYKQTQLTISSYRQNSKTRPPSPGAMKQRPPSPQPTSAKPPPIQKPALTPTGPPTLRKRDSKSKDLCPVQAVSPQSSDSSKTKDKDCEPFSVIRTQIIVSMVNCAS